MKVSILLSSYNGEAYLNEQLDSLVAQDYKNLIVYLRDDGSLDDSRAILLEYQKRYPLLFVVLNDDSSNLKSVGSFLSLLGSNIESDLYMFCDQDDIWDRNKVSQFVESYKKIIVKYGAQIPIALFGDMRLVDSNGALIGKSFWGKDKIPIDNSKSWKLVLGGNVLTGCSSIFNYSARQLFLENRNYSFYHDHQLAILTAKYGVLQPIGSVTASYRQHDGNVLGANTFNLKSILRKGFTLSVFAHSPMLYGVGRIEYLCLKAKVLYGRMGL